MQNDYLKITRHLNTAKGSFTYYNLPGLQKQGNNIEKMPFSIRILLENV
jgi:aconitate hydratase